MKLLGIVFIAFEAALLLGCVAQDPKYSSPPYEFKASTSIERDEDPFTKTGVCKLVHSVNMYLSGEYPQEVNRTEIIVILNQVSPQWLGIIQEHDRHKVSGGGHFLAGTLSGSYFDASLAIENGITEPFSVNYKNSVPTAIISVADIRSWLQSGAEKVNLRRASDNVIAVIHMNKVEEFVEQCL